MANMVELTDEQQAKLDLLGIRLHVLRGRPKQDGSFGTKDTWYAYYPPGPNLVRYKLPKYENVPIAAHTAEELVQKVLDNLK